MSSSRTSVARLLMVAALCACASRAPDGGVASAGQPSAARQAAPWPSPELGAKIAALEGFDRGAELKMKEVKWIVEHASDDDLVRMLRFKSRTVREVGIDLLLERNPENPAIAVFVMTEKSEIVADMLPRVCRYFDKPKVEALMLQAVAKAPDLSTRGDALRCLVKKRPALGRRWAEAFLDDPNTIVTGVEALGALRLPELIPALSALANHADGDVRVAATEALSALDDPAVLPVLREIGLRSDAAASDFAIRRFLTHPRRPKARMALREAEKVLERPARKVMQALAARDVAALSTLVHPTRGLRLGVFSRPHREVFTAVRVRGFASDKREMNWGESCGKGEPIDRTPYKLLADMEAASFLKPGAQTSFNEPEAPPSHGMVDPWRYFEWLFSEYVTVIYSRREPRFAWLTLVFEKTETGTYGLVAVLEHHGCP